jgi:hypothetical protein
MQLAATTTRQNLSCKANSLSSIEEIPQVYGKQMFMAVLTTVRCWFLSCVRRSKSQWSHPLCRSPKYVVGEQQQHVG